MKWEKMKESLKEHDKHCDFCQGMGHGKQEKM